MVMGKPRKLYGRIEYVGPVQMGEFVATLRQFQAEFFEHHGRHATEVLIPYDFVFGLIRAIQADRLQYESPLPQFCPPGCSATGKGIRSLNEINGLTVIETVGPRRPGWAGVEIELVGYQNMDADSPRSHR